MTDKNFALTLELMRSATIRYMILTFCVILGLFFIKKWFVNSRKIAQEDPKV